MRASPPAGGGDRVGALLRAVWSAHGETWPQGLRAVADLMLGACFPMFVVGEPQLRVLYNEACIDLLGDRHPETFGQPLAQACASSWTGMVPAVTRALAGEAVLVEDLAVDIARDGHTTRRYLSLSASPVHEQDQVIAACCVLADTTSRVLAERQHGFHLKLAGRLRELSDPAAITAAASALIGEYLGVGRVGYGEVDLDSAMVSVERDWTDGRLPSLAGQAHPLASFGPALIERLHAGQALCLHDVESDQLAAPYRDAYAAIGVRALIAVPIHEGGRLAAIFFLHEAAPRDWSAREVTLAEDVARHTREGVRRARVEETLRDETRILEVLNRSGQALASTLDLDTLLQAVTDAGTQLSGARFGALFCQREGAREAMRLAALSGAAREVFDGTAGALLAQHCARQLVAGSGAHAPLRSEDLQAAPIDAAGDASGEIRMPPPDAWPAALRPVRSYLAVPLVSHAGTVLGGLVFGHPEPGVFTERTERIVAGVAAQAAVAMDNARLYEVARASALERDALLQSERAARVEAERLSRMKDEFLAMLAHELRNPLAPISSSAGLLNIQFRDEPRIRQASAIISRQVKHMSRLIDDLLDVSRVTRGLVTLQVGEVDLRDVVRSALDQTRPLFEEKAHRIEEQLPAGPAIVHGDATRLIQSVANILNNAAKYTPPAGTIRVALTAEGGHARIAVRDNGSGMPPDLLPSVFDLFTQGARTLARSQGGLGLGLALVKKLVDLHGGAVAAHSDGVGQGSTFTITLPCAAARAGEGAAAPAPRTVPAAPPDAAAYRPLRIIIVDDNEDAADSLATLLRTQGHTVMVEYNARGALRRATGDQPDAMVVDIGLPDMDGYQLAMLLRRQPGTRQVCLIAATGYGQERDRERAREAGFAHHLVKPVDMAALLKILQMLASAPARRG